MDPTEKIRCSVCGQETTDEARFCRRCGARLPRLLDGQFRPRRRVSDRSPPKDWRG